MLNWPSQQRVDGGGIEPPGLLPRRRQGTSHAARCRGSRREPALGPTHGGGLLGYGGSIGDLPSCQVLPAPRPDGGALGVSHRTIPCNSMGSSLTAETPCWSPSGPEPDSLVKSQ
jgi:hypothetical protein